MTKYNGSTKTFISEPLINATWNQLASDAIGTTPVTLGTDLWYPLAISNKLLEKPLYDRVMGGTSADMYCFFYKNDRVYINDITLYCNFADGLVRQSNLDVTPVHASAGSAVPPFSITNVLKLQLTSYYWDKDTKVVYNGIQDISIPHFNSLNKIEAFLPKDSDIPSTAKAQWFEIKIIQDTDNLPSFSTLSIDTTYQNTRCLVWAEVTLSHSFNTNTYNLINDGTSPGWPV